MIRDYDPEKDRDEVVKMLNELNLHQARLDTMKIKKIDDSVGEKAFLQIEEKRKVGDIYIRILEIDDKTAGMSIGFVQKYTNKVGRLLKLFLYPEFRNGNGKILLQDMENIFRAQECKEIRVEAFTFNEKAVSFYEKNMYNERYKIMYKKL